jgi:hypothetical protein
MEVGERLSGNGAVTLRLELTAAAAGPMVAEHGPGPGGRRGGSEVHLNDLAGRVAAHHNMEEHRLLERQGNLEQGVVVDEGDVDSEGIAGVGVNHRITPRRRQCRVHSVEESGP